MQLRWIAPAPSRLTLDHELIWPLVFAAVAVGARFLPALPVPFPRTCFFHFVTGLPCPSCGGTRAIGAFARLDLAVAFAWNPLVATAGVAAVGFTLYAIAAIVLRTRRVRVVGLSDIERLGAVCLVLANWAYLIVVGR